MTNRKFKFVTSNIVGNFVLLLIISSYVTLGFKFFRFIWRFTPNLLFWDQWDIFDYVLFEKNFFKLFLYQHNEHRMGVGLIITKLLASLSGWNGRYETVLIGVLIFVSSIIALLLKRKLFGRYEIYDIIIPFLFLNIYQSENLIWGFQIAFILPVFWLMLSVYIFTFKNSLLKNLSLLFLALLSSYSHLHGLFAGLVISLYFLLRFFQKEKKRQLYLYYFLLTFLIMITYFVNYQPSRFLGASDFKVNQLLLFVSYQINSFIGNYSKKILVFSLPITIVWLFFQLSMKALGRKKLLEDFPIISLSIFPLLFSLSVAYGRIGIGLDTAYTSRYVTLIIPLFLGTYFACLKLLGGKLKIPILTFLLVFFVFASSQNNHFNYTQAQNRKVTLDLWGKCYQEQKNITYCNKSTSYIIHHSPEKINLESKLEYLSKNRLNYFAQDD